MSDGWHFIVFVFASVAAFAGILALATHSRQSPLDWRTVTWVTGVVVIGGMVFAKFGAQSGWPIGVYYGLPALLAWVVPPLALRMNRAEAARYLPLAVVMAPVIHVLFSFLLGWNEYMPFIPVPSLASFF